MPADRRAADQPAFAKALAEIRRGLSVQQGSRSEITFESEPAPRRLAPHAAAVAATVAVGEREIGWGRFVLLHDPPGQDGWGGPFRVIAYLRAELDPEIAADPLVGEVGWSWLTEALDSRSAGYAAASGTVTRVVTEGFGTKRDEPVATEFEMRASWSPVPADGDAYQIDHHVQAWADALCVAAGLPPVAPGVTQLTPPQLRQPRPPRQPPSGRRT